MCMHNVGSSKVHDCVHKPLLPDLLAPDIIAMVVIFSIAGLALAVGVSRKSFIGKVLGSDALEDRAWPTVALTSCCRERGARVFRAHDVKPNVEALRMTEAIIG